MMEELELDHQRAKDEEEDETEEEDVVVVEEWYSVQTYVFR